LGSCDLFVPKEEVDLAHTIVRDVVIWTKHVHGGDTAQQLSGLPGDAEVTLVVDGVRGRWCKMRDGRDGRPTAGLRPVGRAQSFWQSLFESRRGESVSIELESSAEADSTRPEAADGDRWAHARRAEEREAARAAIGLAPALGWSSEGRVLTRDELYDR
jgi:hypothetical protein